MGVLLGFIHILVLLHKESLCKPLAEYSQGLAKCEYALFEARQKYCLVQLLSPSTFRKYMSPTSGLPKIEKHNSEHRCTKI